MKEYRKLGVVVDKKRATPSAGVVKLEVFLPRIAGLCKRMRHLFYRKAAEILSLTLSCFSAATSAQTSELFAGK